MRAAVFALAIFISGPAWAQTSNGTLVGSVVDPSGAVVAKAAVSAVSSAFGQRHETSTDSAGTYRLESLQPGIYTVTITSPGFEALTVAGVVLSGSLTTTINGRLKLAAAQQSIEVQAAAGQVIDTQSGQLGENIDHQELAQLPYLSLNSAELALTLPGVQDSPVGKGAIPTDAETGGIAFSVDGTRPRANNFLIDGQDDNDYGSTGQAYQPINYGAVQEVTILTNSYAAEYGRGGGSVTNYIYKSGTNNFHGDLWEINRNSALAAIPAQDEVASTVTKNPYDNQNVFGFDVGGPLRKDKLFFFGAAQWNRERQAETGPVYNLPTANGIATLQGLEPNANISLFLTAIGPLVSNATAPNTTDIPLGNGRPSVEIGLFQLQNISAATDFLDWNYRMDWQYSEHDTLTGSVIRDNGTVSPESAADLPAFEAEFRGPSEIFRGQWVHTISSKLANELRLSYTNISFSFLPTSSTLAGPLADIPYISFGNDVNFPSIGVNSIYPQGRTHNAWQVQEALSYTSGRHTIKGGVDVTILSLNDTNPLNTRGSIFYNQGGGFSSLGNFIDDFTGSNPGAIAKGFGNPVVNTSATMFAPYIEDTWRVRSNFTVSMGLRYEYWGALANGLPFPSFNTSAGVGLPNAGPSFATDPAEFDSLFSFQQVPDKRNFAPRLGLAYTPHWGGAIFGNGKTVIRAGYGIFYDGMFTNITDNAAESQPNTFGGSFNGPATGRGQANASAFPGITPTLDSTLLIETLASNLHNPLTQQWNVDVQRELPLGLVLTLAYVGTRGERLFANRDFNPAAGLTPSFNYAYLNPDFTEFEVRTNAGDSWYNSGQVEVERRVRTLILRAAYTYSKFFDDTSDVNVTTGGSTFPQILSNEHSDWGPSAYDRRHRFTLAYVWAVPYSRRNTFLRALTDAWQWSGIATIESGTPNTVEIGFDNILNGHVNSRPDLSNPAAPLTSLGVDGGDFGIPGFTPGVFYPFACWDNGTLPCNPAPASTFHFIVPNGVPGNVGRNSLYGPGQIYFDTAIERDFPIHVWRVENQTLSFRVDLFNALNHPNLFTPSYTMTDINFDNTAITINGGREIKLWLKYSF
ncbi:MAG TPA: carboxypeptidase regulatory-like domain-containing protein [Verrucomicrobiae bacterium]|nr:carboxypeptidase regulatory-like domain-containing protein [Verrucomicrobiae bacterium]